MASVLNPKNKKLPNWTWTKKVPQTIQTSMINANGQQYSTFALVHRAVASLIKQSGDARSSKSPHTAHMCGGPKQFGGTKELMDQKTY